MALDLSHQIFGTGPPVIVLHGLLGSARNWRTMADRLAPANTVVTVDLRNHGASPWDPIMDYPAMAADITHLMERLGYRRATLVGHSMGGKAAMALALGQPACVARLVVVDISPVAYRESMLGHVDALLDVQLEGAKRRSDVEEDLLGLVPDPGMRGFLLQNLVRDRDRGFRWRVNLPALQAAANDLGGFDPADDASPYTGPTLFIAGGRSDYVRRDHTPAIRRLFPKAEVVTIPQAGHQVHTDTPDRFATVLRGFLDKTAQAA